jgi:NOL1/NOP2/sun family putative RNA methylase
MNLPQLFTQRMRSWLGDEASDFFASLNHAPVNGLRVNPLKLAPMQLRELVSWPLEAVPWCETGFVLPAAASAGKHPFHAAGLYYLQEPTAMAVAEALPVRAGMRVLDLAASPGGKATHLASRLGETGLLVANEIEARRTQALTENLARWGVRRAIITNAEPARLAEPWGATFDAVLLDAPCSGEGMFRKMTAAREAWSIEHVQGCALRQQKILQSAAKLVRPGGFLVYSTCTFAPEENEEAIARFLKQHDDFALALLALKGATSGCPAWVAAEWRCPELTQTARFWPHRVHGEGHFMALLRRKDGDAPAIKRMRWKPAPQKARAAWRAFVASALCRDPSENFWLVLCADQLYAVLPDAPSFDGLHVRRAGWWLGTWQRERFTPSHSLALALRAADAQQTLDFAPTDALLKRYGQGHPLSASGANGWTLVTVSGFPLGWGYRAQGVVKNFYPKGLRLR